MNCCQTIDIHNPPIEIAESISVRFRCDRCKTLGRAVARKTVLLMLKSDFLEQAMNGRYRFCTHPDCPVVYFPEGGGPHFTVNDLRVRVGIKVKDDPIPLCYCFGFDESHIRHEIAQTGCTSVPEKVSNLIRQGLCACDTRNPLGVCCLSEVIRVSKQLVLESVDSFR